LERMKNYQGQVQAGLKKSDLPSDLLAIPLIESGYRPLHESVNPVQAAGIWQIIPSTAKRFGLVVDANRDDRLDTALSTQAALDYLKFLHTQFHDWKLAVLAYNIGEDQVERLITATGSRDAWVLVRSSHIPEKYKSEATNYLAMLDASILIMHQPSLITQ
jgi:membrane-bound lytic murein transglycosylase D